MKKVKISLGIYIMLRNKVKFLEYYWAMYQLENEDFKSHPHYPAIQTFVSQNLYDKLTFIKINRLRKSVVISKNKFEKLQQYARISDEIFSTLKPFSHMLKERR